MLSATYTCIHLFSVFVYHGAPYTTVYYVPEHDVSRIASMMEVRPNATANLWPVRKAESRKQVKGLRA